MSTKGNITLCLTSLAAGAALGLLLAPTSGRETRRNLVRKGEEMKDKLTDLYEEGTQMMNRGRDQFADVADRARDKAEGAAQNVKDQVKSATSGTAGNTTSRTTSGTGSTGRS